MKSNNGSDRCFWNASIMRGAGKNIGDVAQSLADWLRSKAPLIEERGWNGVYTCSAFTSLVRSRQNYWISLSWSPHFAPEGCVFPNFPFFNSGRRSVIPRIFFEFPCSKPRRDHKFCSSQNEIGNGKSEGHSRSMNGYDTGLGRYPLPSQLACWQE